MEYNEADYLDNVVIYKANLFLDAIKKPEPEKIEKIKTFIKKMMFLDFNNPYIGDLKNVKQSDEDEAEERKKQIEQIKKMANEKKMTLARMKVAYYSHLLLKFVKKYVPELKDMLAYNGDHISLLINSGDLGILVHHLLMDKFERSKGKHITYLVKVKVNKKIHEFKISNLKNIKERAKRIYGKDAKIIEKKIVETKRALIKSRLLFSCFVASACRLAYEEYMRQNKEEDKEIIKYNKILNENGLISYVIPDRLSEFEKAKKALLEQGFAEKVDETIQLKQDVRKKIEQRRQEQYLFILDRVIELTILPLFRYILTSTKKSRKKEKLFPRLSSEISETNLSLFSFLRRKGIDEKIIKLIYEKEGQEEKYLDIDPYYFGLVFLNSRGIEKKKLKQIVWFDENKFEEELRKIGENENRASEFLKKFGD